MNFPINIDALADALGIDIDDFLTILENSGQSKAAASYRERKARNEATIEQIKKLAQSGATLTQIVEATHRSAFFVKQQCKAHGITLAKDLPDHIWTNEEKLEILRRHENGETYREIAESYNKPESRIYTLAKHAKKIRYLASIDRELVNGRAINKTDLPDGEVEQKPNCEPQSSAEGESDD